MTRILYEAQTTGSIYLCIGKLELIPPVTENSGCSLTSVPLTTAMNNHCLFLWQLFIQPKCHSLHKTKIQHLNQEVRILDFNNRFQYLTEPTYFLAVTGYNCHC